MGRLNKTDRDAMKRAIEIVRQRDKASRAQIDSMLETDSFEEVGTFAAFSCQMEALDLAPWQTPPLWVRDLAGCLKVPFGDQRGEREAAELVRRLISAGLSHLEPDPLGALDRANAAQADKSAS